MSNELPKEDRSLISFFNAFHAIGSINNLREHDHLGGAIESVVEEALLRLQVMRPRNCDLERRIDEIRRCLADDIESATRQPPRNCDVGTPEEQIERHQQYCHDLVPVCRYVPISLTCRMCFAEWAQKPYKREGFNPQRRAK